MFPFLVLSALLLLCLDFCEQNLQAGFSTNYARFICLVARIGSSDPVRVLRLYTANTLDEVCSIYCLDICTTCRYQSMCDSTGASGPTALSVCSRLCLVANCLLLLCYCSVLYCMMPFIATCVDTIGTVFWDRPNQLHIHGNQPHISDNNSTSISDIASTGSPI